MANNTIKFSGRSRVVPVTIVSGFENSGKSSLIEHLINSLGSKRLVALHDDGETEIFEQIEEAIGLQAADVILIETTPNLEPFFVAEHLTLGDDERSAPEGIKVDTVVTVIDCSRFLDEIFGDQELLDRGLAFDEEDDRSISELLIEQAEFADVIIMNKIDRVSLAFADRLEALLNRLNPRANVVRAEYGRVAADAVIETGAFDLEETDDGAGWLAELSGDFSPEEPAHHGVSSFTFTDRRPFHPMRFNELLSSFAVEGLVRAKGYVWVASRHHEIGIWSLAGPASLLTYGGAWFAATPARDWPKDPRERAEIMEEWTPPFGDRRQEIAFIGVDLSERDVRERLSECLLTSEEMKDGPGSWFAIPDPLPDWHPDTDPEEHGGNWS